MLNFTKKDIQILAANNTFYARGIDYFTSGMVKKLSFGKDELTLRATVTGSQKYRIEVSLKENGKIGSYKCNCPAFSKYPGACKHVVAVLLKALDQYENNPSAVETPLIIKNETQTSPISPPRTPAPSPPDPKLALSKSLLASLKQISPGSAPKEQLRLEVTLHLDATTNSGMTRLALKVGSERLYVVKDTPDFLEAIIRNQDLPFGKTFTLQPSRQQFPLPEKRMIEFLYDVYRDEKTVSYYATNNLKQTFTLKPSQLKQFLELSESLAEVYWVRGYNVPAIPLRIYREPLPVSLQITQGKKYIELILLMSEPIRKVVNTPGVFMMGDRIYIPPTAELPILTPLLDIFVNVNMRNQTLPLTEEDAATVITEIVPALQKHYQLEISPEVERRLHQAPLSIALWLDRQDGGITAKVHFKYGDTEINPLDSTALHQDMSKILLRDKTGEADFLNCLSQAGFTLSRDCYLLTDETKIYTFLRETLPEITENAEVYRSESFDTLRLKRPPRFSGGIRLDETSDLLEISFEIENLPETELQEFFLALREKRNYYRLKTGGFIPLDEPETIAAGRLLDQLGFNGTDLQKQLVSLPKHRAIYLEQAIRDYGRERFHLNQGFKQLIQDLREPQDMEWTPPSHLESILRDYQRTGFKWLKTLSHYGFGGILADDMGLGKTLQVIALVDSEYPSTQLPSLVIAPSALVYNWREEITKFAPHLPVLVLDGQKPERLRLLAKAQEQAFVITSYPLLRRDIEEIKEHQFAYCILDEAQQIKNPQTINAKSVKQIKGKCCFAVTGTPIENSLTELWSIFDFLMPGYLYSHAKFQSRFETPIVKNASPDAADDLSRHIRPFILRRLKKDVLTELPEKIETKLTCEMTDEQKKVYLAYLSQARSEFEAEIAASGFEKSQIKILALLTRLRQICCHPSLFLEAYHGGSGKLELLQEIIADSLDGGHRILLFSQFVSMLNLIDTELRREKIRYFRIDGQTPPEERLKRVHEFNRGDAEVFLISLKAGGTGLNLTGADTVIHYDPWWNPAVEDQATDRAYRIGQKHVVQVFKLVTRGAIEEKIYALQQKKKELVDAVIQPGENFLGKMTLSEIRGLFQD